VGSLFKIIPDKDVSNVSVKWSTCTILTSILNCSQFMTPIQNDDDLGLRSQIKMTFKASSVPDYKWLNWSSIIVPAVAWKAYFLHGHILLRSEEAPTNPASEQPLLRKVSENLSTSPTICSGLLWFTSQKVIAVKSCSRSYRLPTEWRKTLHTKYSSDWST